MFFSIITKSVLFTLSIIIISCFFGTFALEEETKGNDSPIVADDRERNIDQLIAQLSNKTGKFPPGGPFGSKFKNKTSTVATTTTTTSTTAAPTMRTGCTCGTGGKPNVNFTTTTRSRTDFKDDEDFFDDDEEENDDSTFKRKVGVPADDVRIVHGVGSRENGWPWMVALINGFSTTNTSKLNQFCGGSLINPQHVVTAAHCFRNFSSNAEIVSQVRVVLGTNSIASNVTDRTVSSIVSATIHPLFNATTFDNDIAILKLALPVNLSSTIAPICLSQTGAPFNSRNAIVAGWGSTNVVGNTSVTYLREAGLRTMPNSKCIAAWPDLTSRMICTDGVKPLNSSEVCRGDSGGGLMLFKPVSKTYTLIGLVSHGPTVCAKTGVPTVFTRISSFIDFIRENGNSTTFCSNSFLP